jgi:hypothetical protein
LKTRRKSIGRKGIGKVEEGWEEELKYIGREGMEPGGEKTRENRRGVS